MTKRRKNEGEKKKKKKEEKKKLNPIAKTFSISNEIIY